MRTRIRSQRGQILALTTMTIVALLGMSAFVLDVGAWFRENRRTQQVADASALAGAQALPSDPGNAQNLALTYANSKNGGTVGSGDIQLSSSQLGPDDTIKVTARSTSPSFFAKVLGFGDVNISASATARVYVMSQARYAAPFGVERDQPELVNKLFGPANAMSLDVKKTGPGNFKLIEIDGSKSGVQNQTLASWISQGYSGLMGTGWFSGDTGVKFNDAPVTNALDQVTANGGTDLLFPVYDQVQAQGTNFQYNIVGWATFHLTGYEIKGNCEKNNQCLLDGYFVSVVWNGVDGGDPSNYFGTGTVKLVG